MVTLQTTLKSLLSQKKIDFIFVDGGHSVKTILSDWENVKKIMSKINSYLRLL